MEKRTLSKVNFEFALLVIIGGLALVFFAQTFTYEGTITGLFPRIVSSLVILMVAYLLVFKSREMPGSAQDKAGDGQVGAWGKSTTDLHPMMKWQVSVLLMIAYFALIYLIGFGIATFLYALAIPVLLQYKNKLVTVIFALVTAVLLVVLFGVLLYVPLPQGLIFELLFGG